MSDAKATVLGYIEHGEPRTGLWCDTCALPSRIEVTVYVLGNEGGVSTLGELSLCTECDQ